MHQLGVELQEILEIHHKDAKTLYQKSANKKEKNEEGDNNHLFIFILFYCG